MLNQIQNRIDNLNKKLNINKNNAIKKALELIKTNKFRRTTTKIDNDRYNVIDFTLDNINKTYYKSDDNIVYYVREIIYNKSKNIYYISFEDSKERDKDESILYTLIQEREKYQPYNYYTLEVSINKKFESNMKEDKNGCCIYTEIIYNLDEYEKKVILHTISYIDMLKENVKKFINMEYNIEYKDDSIFFISKEPEHIIYDYVISRLQLTFKYDKPLLIAYYYRLDNDNTFIEDSFNFYLNIKLLDNFIKDNLLKIQYLL